MVPHKEAVKWHAEIGDLKIITKQNRKHMYKILPKADWWPIHIQMKELDWSTKNGSKTLISIIFALLPSPMEVSPKMSSKHNWNSSQRCPWFLIQSHKKCQHAIMGSLELMQAFELIKWFPQFNNLITLSCYLVLQVRELIPNLVPL